MINHIDRMRVTARLRAQHILAAFPVESKVAKETAGWKDKVAYYYKKFKYEFSINQMQEARRSYAMARIFAQKIDGTYKKPEVANVLAVKE